MKIEWNVFFIDTTTTQIKQYNVFDNYTFLEKTKELVKECTTILEFSEMLQYAVRYCFAWKFEYEIVVSDMFNRVEKKFDIRHQLELNWKAFVEYIWKYRDEF